MWDFSGTKVADVMTKSPRCIEPHQPVKLAWQWMDELKVRHLPVRESCKIVGIVSERDLSLIASSARASRDLASQKVEDAMVPGVLMVSETDSLKSVAVRMLSHRVGSAVVVGADGGALGIFTDSDALKILGGQL
jgi:acetoin utilization protein AcuB